MIKVAMLTPNLSVGGAERWVVSLIKHSDPTRLQWTGCALAPWGGMSGDIMHTLSQCVPIFSGPMILKTIPKGRPTPASVSPLDCEKYLTRLGSMSEAVQRACDGADVVVAWGSHQYRGLLKRAKKSANMPKNFVLCSHASHIRPHEIKPVEWCRTYLVAVSEKSCKPFQYAGNPPVSVVYNGTSVMRLTPKWGRERIRSQWKVTNETVIGYIGRQTSEKNPGAACEAMTILDDNKWRAVYYGNLPQGQLPPRGAIIEDSKRLRYPHIQFYDYTANVADVYAGIDVLMLASNSEAFSLTLLEGWLTQTPVVSTPVGSVPELEQKYGQLTFGVPLHPTAKQLADACQRAATGPGSQEIVERAYALAQQHFTARAMGNRWVDYLELVMADAAAASPGDVDVWTPSPEYPPVVLGPRKTLLDLDL